MIVKGILQCMLVMVASCQDWDVAGDSPKLVALNISSLRHHHRGATIVDYTGYTVFRLRPTQEQFDLIQSFCDEPGFDVWAIAVHMDPHVDIMVSPARKRPFVRFLADNNIAHSVLIKNVPETLHAERVGPTRRFEASILSRYQRYETFVSFMHDMESRYPATVRVESLGRTHEGRDILVMQISSARDEGRPVVLIDAGVHAREWIAPAAALTIMQRLVEDSHHADMLHRLDWHIIPLLNPDGYEYSHTTARFWRKNRSPHSGSSCLGTDINRNFDIHWNEVGTSKSPCRDEFPGARPSSELETTALSKYALALGTRIRLYLSLHSYGRFILYPWGYSRSQPADWHLLQSVAEKANEAQERAGGVHYVVGSSAKVLYPAAGGSDDWMKAVCGVNLSYTVELPGGGRLGFDMPPQHIEQTVAHFFEAVHAFGKEVEQLLPQQL